MRILQLIARVGLFVLILSLGTMASLLVGEQEGLALADLSRTPVQAMTAAEGSHVLYASLLGDSQASGIYRSDDSGRAWQLVSSGPGVHVNALAVMKTPTGEGEGEAGAVLYAGTNGGPGATAASLWRSHDSGQTWYRSFMTLPADPQGMIPSVTALAVDPGQPGVLYVGTAGHGVYRFDEGRTGYGYELLGGVSLYAAHVNGLVIDPQGRLYALTNEGLFVNRGDVWQNLPAPEIPASLAVAPDDPELLYAGGVSTGVYRSRDGGRTWEPANNGIELIPGVALRVTALAVEERENTEYVVAATAYGIGSQLKPGNIYESHNSGDSWTQVAQADDGVKQLTLKDGSIYAATAGGLMRYGEPSPTASLSRLQSLANPSGVQILILALSVALAALVLLSPLEWVMRRNRANA
jgi:photosystem II stability/assembly factor-like uncharacterized protein